ncbi:MAG: GDP-mannose 4,6-dehydratase [Planctomycetaceae bacterium]|nr:GDP-mannose 4,6-dehydratase [Planctomycetaceae bacterium]
MPNGKTALITGITGQDGAYLARLLTDKGYAVHGIVRRASSPNTVRLETLFPDKNMRPVLHHGDMTDAGGLTRIVAEVRPDEIYNLAAMSHVQVSFDNPEYTGNVDGLGVIRILEAVRETGLAAQCRFYQASTSELYGGLNNEACNETTPFHPRSPYGIAKLYGYWATVNYREAYGMFACNGILFNHESPLRGETFVTRKITKAVAAYKNSIERKEPVDSQTAVLKLGNIDARRDWGHAADYVAGMYLMLQQPEPDDYVLATGENHSVRDFVEAAFAAAGRTIEWRGSGEAEKAFDTATGNLLVEIDPAFYRPAEVPVLLGDPSKARAKLGWQPQYTFAGLVNEMMDAA